MAGDVFGNGMLYTDKLRLQAVFNPHIFLDPDPTRRATRNAGARSTPQQLAGHNAELISEGGGVFERAASIPLSPQKAMLDVDGAA